MHSAQTGQRSRKSKQKPLPVSATDATSWTKERAWGTGGRASTGLSAVVRGQRAWLGDGRKKGGRQELRFLLFLCMVAPTEHMVLCNLLENFNKRGWREGRKTGDQRGERGRDGREEGGDRRNEKERGRKLTKQKFLLAKHGSPLGVLPTFPECGDWRVLFFSFLPHALPPSK